MQSRKGHPLILELKDTCGKSATVEAITNSGAQTCICTEAFDIGVNIPEFGNEYYNVRPTCCGHTLACWLVEYYICCCAKGYVSHVEDEYNDE
jgi:hypothetical protein